MSTESASTENPTAASATKQMREQSTIGFPYGDLDDACGVVTALVNCGGVPSDADQVAAQMKQVPTSGAFRMKIATARMFGLIETVQGRYQLTQLGFAIADAARHKAAKADAFLQVPLYRKVYEQFRNQQLPPRPLALERTFVQFGVAQKQADKARMAFDRSAQQAGFFDQGGRDRLIRPPVGSVGGPPAESPAEAAEPPATPDASRRGNAGGGGTGGGDYHPFVLGLLDTLPAPGTVWTIEGRAAWLEAAASAFKLIYRGDGKITVGITYDGDAVREVQKN